MWWCFRERRGFSRRGHELSLCWVVWERLSQERLDAGVILQEASPGESCLERGEMAACQGWMWWQGSETLASTGTVWILQGTQLGLGELQPAWGLCSALQFLISRCFPLKRFPVHPLWAKHACFTLLALLQVNKKMRKWKCSLWGW